MEKLSEHYAENTAWFDEILGVGRSVDIVSRDYLIGGRRARLWVLDYVRQDARSPELTVPACLGRELINVGEGT